VAPDRLGHRVGRGDDVVGDRGEAALVRPEIGIVEMVVAVVDHDANAARLHRGREIVA
jgi:hypothetical protein